MKVLVLSCNTGGGHNSCGKYILEELKQNSIECDFKNYFEIVHISKRDFSNKIYVDSLGKKGGLFKYLYKIGEIYDNTKITSPVYLATSALSNRLYQYIKRHGYDLVICPHLFPALSLTAINKKHKVKFIFVATDYEYHPFTDEIKADYYVIPKGLEDRFESKGIKRDKLLSFGIPISTRFIEEAKDISNEYNANRKKVLILLGSMGFGSIEKSLNKILEIDNIYITIVCGKNTKLYNRLKENNNINLNILGYSNNINDLIKTSDVVISKPGGLSTTEIAVFRKGLIHAFPIPGVETSNTEFFSKNNLSLVANTPEEMINYIKLLFENKEVYNKMIKNQEKIINSNSAKDLVQFINNHL